MQRRLGLDVPIVEMLSNDPRLPDLGGWDPTDAPVPRAARRVAR